MKLMIPDELFNANKCPQHGSASVRVADYVKILLLRLPSCSAIMIERAFWNTVCDFCNRTGALVERKTGTVSSGSKTLALTAPVYGDFLRFVGAGMNNAPVSAGDVTASSTNTYPSITFNTASASVTAYADFSVAPNINASHDSTPVTVGTTTTYPNDKWILPEWFLSKYDAALVAGTNFSIFSMVGRRWTDYNSAKINAFTYNREINRITTGILTSGMRKKIMVGMETPMLASTQNNDAATPADSTVQQ